MQHGRSLESWEVRNMLLVFCIRSAMNYHFYLKTIFARYKALKKLEQNFRSAFINGNK